MNPYSLPPFLAAMLNFTLVYWVYRQAAPGSIRRTFLLWNSWLGLWNIGIGVGYILSEPHAAYLWYKGMAAILIGFIAPFFLHFVAVVTESDEPQTRRMIQVGYGVGVCISLLGALTPLLMNDVRKYFWGYYPRAGDGEWMYGSSYVFFVAYAAHLLYKAIRRTSGTRRNQLEYLMLGALICFGGGITNFLPLYGVGIYPFGNLLNSVYSLVVAYAIFEYGLMDIRVILSRGVVYTLLSGGLTAVYLSIVAVLQRLFGHYGVQESVAFYMAAFPVTVVLAPTMKSRIEPFVDHAFFGGILRRSKPPLKNQDMAFMGVLATEMAHELAKPLTHIMNAGSQLERSIKGSSRKNLRTIEKEVQRVSEILDGFAMLAPERTLHRIAVPLADLMEEAVTALRLNEDHTIRIVRRFGNLPPVFVNPGQIVQVLTNLIQNAWQAMPNGGQLTLSIRAAAGQKVTAHAEISIADTGRGIDPEIAQRVFEPFFTTKQAQGGRGMGLTISRAMVQRHDGTIEIQSPVTTTGGTRVVVRLPAKPMKGAIP